MSQPEVRFVPAAGRPGLTRLYDPVVALTMREHVFRNLLVAQVSAGLPPHGGTILDVGCGTGTLAILMSARIGGAHVTGIDGDDEVLATARGKAHAETVTWARGLGDELPWPDATFDRVTMSLLLHHLEAPAKLATLREAVRVLRPGGRLHIADWGRPQDPVMHLAFVAIRVLDGFSNTADHAAGRLPLLMEASGFAPPELHTRLRTVWGTLELLSAATSSRSGGA